LAQGKGPFLAAAVGVRSRLHAERCEA